MIVDINFYTEMGFNCGNSPDEVGRALEKAERVINLFTGGKCDALCSLHPTAQSHVKTAICEQAESYIINGFNEVQLDHKVKIGDFSYESKNNGVTNDLAPAAAAILKLSGLVYAGTEVKN
ncbi:MAG: hypothetical protein FWH20_00300 [Oscillospiraceae bacterium]|nr:hypothetical protein [Oscillospiraceae bacterium]